jgi:redox-sensitive bicupin YhaK (pirin superfamily)
MIHYAQTRGRADHGWLRSYHTFSFADYHDPQRMGFGALRVINDDSVAPARGFGTHPHRDMEIISLPLQGSLFHRDSEGNQGLIKKGEIQLMSAGSGIHHSEMNASETDEVKFLQIWVLPRKAGGAPRYQQKKFLSEIGENKFLTLVSPDGREGSLTINQDAFFSLGNLADGHEWVYRKNLITHGVYVFIIDGQAEVNGQGLNSRDGIGVSNPDSEILTIKSLSRAEILVIEVPL